MNKHIYIYIYVYIYIYIYICIHRAGSPRGAGGRGTSAAGLQSRHTPSPPTKSLGFRGLDSSKLLILKGGNSHVHIFNGESPGKFDSRTLNRTIISRWTGRKCN